MARDLAQRAQAAAQRSSDNNAPSLQQQLMGMETQFQRAMPRGVEAVQLIRDVMTCVKQTPKLAQCDSLSVLGSAMTCAQLGLRPGVGALGHAWILPFYDKKSQRQRAQLIIGYKGFVELGQRSDRIGSLHSRIVYENDEFHLKYGLASDDFEHIPYFMRGHDESGESRLFYAVGRLANGGTAMADPMTRGEMEKHRDRFAMAKYEGRVIGPWADHFDPMGKKTMLLRLMALMPKTTEIQRALDNDGSVRMDLSESAIDTPTHIDGEVIGEDTDMSDDNGGEPERETVTVSSERPAPRGKAKQANEPNGLATPAQVKLLAQIRAREWGTDDEGWFSVVASISGAQVNSDALLTAEQAQQVIDYFNTPTNEESKA